MGYRQVTGSMSSNSLAMAKSYRLTMEAVQKKHPELPHYIYRWSASYFYSYLLGKSLASGDYSGALAWLFQAIKADYLNFLRLGVYKIFAQCSLKILFNSLVFLLVKGKENSPKVKLKNSKSKLIEINDILDLNKQMNIKDRNKRKYKPYDVVLAWRWNQALKICQKIL